MAVTFLRLKTDLRLIFPIYHMMQTFRLNSKKKDSMETFANDLAEQKKNRYLQIRKETIKNRNKSQDENTLRELNLIDDIHKFLDLRDEESLEILIDDAWAEKHAISKIHLPIAVLCEALEFASSVGNTQLFKKLFERLKIHDKKFISQNSSYFNALGLELEFKTSTNNIDELLLKFEKLYEESFDDDKNTKQIMRFCSVIIEDCVNRRGESVVIKLKTRIEKMCESSKDYQLLLELWRRLFESFWFSDQQMASEIIAKHAVLRKLLSKQLSSLCFIYLRNNNTELVNRLIQIFLQFNMMKQVEILLKILLDFECWRKNLDAALQIVQLCLKLEIVLSDKENTRFLDLMLKRPRDDKTRPAKKKITIQKYQFKF